MAEGKRKRVPRAVREQQMLDAAVAEFGRSGFHAASMDDIAERAGVSKPLLYLYMESKEELFARSVSREIDRLITAMGETTYGPVDQPEQQLWSGLVAFFEYVGAHADSWAVLSQQAAGHGPAIVDQLDRARDGITRTVTLLLLRSMDAAGSAGEPGVLGEGGAAMATAEAAAHALVGAASSVAVWAAGQPEETPERAARRLMNLLWIGMQRAREGVTFTPAASATSR